VAVPAAVLCAQDASPLEKLASKEVWNEQLVEINMRRTVFCPEKPGVNYIAAQGVALSAGSFAVFLFGGQRQTPQHSTPKGEVASPHNPVTRNRLW
jgi:hypothetical protein